MSDISKEDSYDLESENDDQVAPSQSDDDYELSSESEDEVLPEEGPPSDLCGFFK